jgi:hypothetical protein
MKRDLLWHVLYDDDLELMRHILLQPTRRAQDAASEPTLILHHVRRCANVACMRVLFFCILAADEQLRADITSPAWCSRIWTTHGKCVHLEHHKAERFYKDLLPECIHRWMRHEEETCSRLVDSLRMLYLCS